MINNREIHRKPATNDRVLRDIIAAVNTTSQAGRIIRRHAENALKNEPEFIEYSNYNTALADCIDLIQGSILGIARGKKPLSSNIQRVLNGIWYALARPGQYVDELELRLWE